MPPSQRSRRWLNVLLCWLAVFFSFGVALASPDGATVTLNGNLAYDGVGSNLPLPDIVISESVVGTLRPSGYFAIAAPYDKVIGFDVRRASVRAFRIDNGNEVSDVFIGKDGLLADPAPANGNVADVAFSLTRSSSSETGLLRVVVSGLRARIAGNALYDIFLTMGGADSLGTNLDTLDKIGASRGAGVAQTVLKVGAIFPVECIHCGSEALVNGPITAQTITLLDFASAGGDRNKAGSIFVAAILDPWPYGNLTKVYFLNDAGLWERFTSCATAPAYFQGILSAAETISIPIVPRPTDLSALRGTMLYVGYGLPLRGNACENMLDYGTYARYYTIN